VLAGLVVAAFVAGGAAVVWRLWVLFWVCAGLVLLAIPLGWMIGIMNDTVQVEQGPRRRWRARAGPPTPGVRFD
jgi:hypothetical protein